MVGRDKGYRRGASRPARARVRRRLAGLLVTLQGPKFTLGEPKSAAAAILQRSPARCKQRGALQAARISEFQRFWGL